MSKWFSARFKGRCGALAAFALLGLGGLGGLGGCDKLLAPLEEEQAETSGSNGVRTRPDTAIPDIASAEPGKDRRLWRASNEATRLSTGYLTASLEGRSGPLTLAFAEGITLTLERDVRVGAGEKAGRDGETFASLMSVDTAADIYLYRVTRENVLKTAKQGGLCKKNKAVHLAVSEFVGRDGEWVFKVAAFRGKAPPGAGGDPEFCAAYQYALL